MRLYLLIFSLFCFNSVFASGSLKRKADFNWGKLQNEKSILLVISSNEDLDVEKIAFDLRELDFKIEQVYKLSDNPVISSKQLKEIDLTDPDLRYFLSYQLPLVGSGSASTITVGGIKDNKLQKKEMCAYLMKKSHKLLLKDLGKKLKKKD